MVYTFGNGVWQDKRPLPTLPGPRDPELKNTGGEGSEAGLHLGPIRTSPMSRMDWIMILATEL